jgi:hypothetical protein
VCGRRGSGRSGRALAAGSASARTAAVRPRGDDGSVTAETAVALPALVVLLVAALTAVSAVSAQLRCVDAAGETVRAAARGDTGGADAGQRTAPAGATVTVTGDTRTVRAVVTARVAPVGSWLPAVTVRATAVAAREPDGLP